MNKKFSMVSMVLMASLLGGCGRPPAEQGGPPPDFPVLAVVAKAESRDWTETLKLVGTLKAAESVDIVSEVDARLLEIGFEEGQPVSKGDTLFTFDDGKLKAFRDQAQAAFRLAQSNRSRAEELLANETISQQEYDQADATFASAEASLAAAEDNLADANIVAPFDGVMSARTVSAGQFVARGQVLASLVQVDPMDVVFDVPGRFVAGIRQGDKVQFTTPAWPDTSFDADVVYLAPRLDEQTRTLNGKARLKNPEGLLRPGMFGQVELRVGDSLQAVVIPSASVNLSADGARVVVMGDDGRAVFRSVSLGRRQQDWIEVKDGLDAGEILVVEGHQKMGPGTRIQISEKSKVYGVEPPVGPDSGEAL